MRITKEQIEQQLEVSLGAPSGVEYVPDMTTVVGRLKHLRHVVERIDPAKFEMESFARTDACGTVGCMLGWAAFDPHFNSIGYRADHKFQDEFWVMAWPGKEPRGAGWYGEIGEDVFGISFDDSLWLFNGDAQDDETAPVTQGMALARIDRMIAKYAS